MTAVQFDKGDQVGVPCEVAQGAFPDEYLITIESDFGTISGFVSSDDVRLLDDKRGLVRAVVEDIDESMVTLRVQGSYFTTTGIAHLGREWAISNLETQSAA